MLASAGTYFGVEIGRFDSWLPADEALAAISAPVQVLVSDDSPPFFGQAAGRLADRLGVETTRTRARTSPIWTTRASWRGRFDRSCASSPLRLSMCEHTFDALA
jgi:hypothetical protein